MNSDQKELKKQIIDLCWYMRGSITYDQAWSLSPNERKLIFDLVKENIKRTEESGIPLL